MQKIAWFITHDDYIDRRIFFFTDVLQQNGYSVKLFPAAYLKEEAEKEEDFICRPVERKLLREYNVKFNNLTDIEKKLVEYIKGKLNEVGLRNKKRITVDIPDNLAKEIKVNWEKDSYTVEVSFENYKLFYDWNVENYVRIYNSKREHEVYECERALISFLKKKNIENENIKLTYFQNRNQEECIYINIKYGSSAFIYNIKMETLLGLETYPYGYDVDVINDEKYDYSDFKKIIYDYSPIINRVEAELQKEKPDIVYVADLPTLPIGYMLKETVGCQLIIDCHEWWYKQTILWEKENKKKIELVDYYEKELYKKCDLRITVGKHLAKRMELYYGCCFDVIYSCMSQNMICSDEREYGFLQRKYHINEKNKVAIFQGGMSTFRNLDNLARATKYLSDDAYLLLLTTGEYQEVFKKVLCEEGKPERVIWGGWIPQNELLKYTQNADVGIIPYTAVNDYAECFVPNKLMEYFEAKIPILFDDSIREISMVAGENHVGIGADLTNPEEFGKKLNSLLHNEEKLRDLRRNYEQCKEKFTFLNQKRLFEEILKKSMEKDSKIHQ